MRQEFNGVIFLKKHTALYTRVSTEAQAEEGYSIEAQKKLLEAWCVSREVVSFEFYTDAGFSGSNLERPEIKKLLENIRKGLVDTVAVYKLDRLSRSQKDTLYLIEDVFNPYGVGFVSLSENMDTATPIGRAMLGIMSAFAQLERETIRIRTRMGMKERVKRGLWMGGGKIPFGYSYDKESGTLVKNEDSETVKKIYSMYLQGYSPSYIAKALGLKYERLVVQILKRKTNIGAISYKDEEYEGLHEPIIDKETYLLAQEEMRRRSRHIEGSVHLLSGLLYCGLCGARMRYQKWGKNGYKLVCYSTQNSKPYLVRDPNCKAERIWADEVELYLLDDLFSMQLKKDKKGDCYQVKPLQNKLKKLEKKLQRLYGIYADGDDTVLEVIRQIKTEIQECRELIEEAERKRVLQQERSSTIENAERLSEIWDTLTDEEKKRIVKSVVERITVYPEKIEIRYY